MDKFILKSKTIWGIIVTIAPILLPLFGISFGENDAELIGENADKIISGVGALFAAYGRMKAGGIKIA